MKAFGESFDYLPETIGVFLDYLARFLHTRLRRLRRFPRCTGFLWWIHVGSLPSRTSSTIDVDQRPFRSPVESPEPFSSRRGLPQFGRTLSPV